MSLKDDLRYGDYVELLQEELIQALGCTEPIAIAYASAKAREVLGKLPEKILVKCSKSIIKNAKSVLVPNTGNLKGIKASSLAGVIGGDASKKMRVLESVTEEDIKKINQLLDTDICKIEMLDDVNLHIIVFISKGQENALVEIMNTHTNIVRIEKDGHAIYEDTSENIEMSSPENLDFLTVKGIYEFTEAVDLEDVKFLLDKQIECNLNIAEEGLRNTYGAEIGRSLIELYGDNIYAKLRAYASAGSDARMNGCSLPVVINSGSGNQGITVSLPVIIYAREKGVDEEKMYRALVLSNLLAIYFKSGIGRLSAYCGAVTAACGSGAAITYLEGGTLKHIEDTITNTLANVSGIICDGAKSSCAAKIASGIDAAILGHFLAMKNISFSDGDGIVKAKIDKTVQSVWRLGKEGMKETDDEILKIMLEE